MTVFMAVGAAARRPAALMKLFDSHIMFARSQYVGGTIVVLPTPNDRPPKLSQLSKDLLTMPVCLPRCLPVKPIYASAAAVKRCLGFNQR
jgi:hypothetical protein